MNTVSEEELIPLRSLIKLLDVRTPLSSKQEKALNEPYQNQVSQAMMNSGMTHGEVTGAPGIALNTRNEDEFKSYLRKIDNDLSAQLKIVLEGVEHYFKTGVIPPPYYAWRVAVILRKKKRYALEAIFCEVFSKHFYRGVGERYIQILDRIVKAQQLASK